MRNQRREIEPLGSFFSQTKDGYVINPASPERLVSPWLEALEEIRQIYIQKLGEQLHSVYVRGSVAFGTAIAGFSDLDSFCLVYPRGTECVIWQALPWSDDAPVQRLGFPCAVEFVSVTFHHNFARVNPIVSMIIKTQSLCIHGPDIGPALPDCRPGLAMMMDAELLDRQLSAVEAELTSGRPVSPEQVQSLMKRILRTGFELVMERENRYATSLYLLYMCFSRHYPEREADMRWVLETFLNPDVSPLQLRDRLTDFGIWLRQEVASVLAWGVK
ncbi:hypothetical protein KMZ15_01865 [Mycoavidus sp. HKI]|uniref:hypothetical protein n=1 Tax=Mycoavidus sp. HKI TaxID=2840467 RepID=UPI001CBE7B8F|nr:hypothetical protein [Mycoavidus sp. HKI]UAW64458.1 hypothetical protein KMZ15_01865 [Mycoavidus sp. HKI]